MYKEKLKRRAENQWCIEPFGTMNVPVIIYADEKIIAELDDKVYEQAANVARLPGIVKASFAMPDAHWGYGFPIGGVAAFDPDKGGVISAGGVGFDIACGVRTLRTGLTADDLAAEKTSLADGLAAHIPAGLGSSGKLQLSKKEMDVMLTGGAEWAVDHGYGTRQDLAHTEENGRMKHARPQFVSDRAKQRQKNQVGTLGSGNHYLEVQKVTKLYDAETADKFDLHLNDLLVSIHCGSRGLGHQIATDYLPRMVNAARTQAIGLPERELACASIHSEIGRQYFGAMNCGINCAAANRQVLTHLIRRVFSKILPKADLTLLYDVSHNTCKLERHTLDGKPATVYVHRKGATRAFGPHHPSLPPDLKPSGQPVLIGGTMGTASHIMVGTEKAMTLAFGSCCHGAGRAMSRRQALKSWHGREIIKALAEKNIIIRGTSNRGIAEESPGAYKDVDAVVDATEEAGLAKKVVRLKPVICIKG